MAETQRIYPQGAIAQGNGDLIQVTNCKFSYSNGAKQKHTLRRRGAGIVFGNDECTVTFDSEITEDGPERNYWKDAMERRIRQIRFKVPGGVTVLTVDGAYSQVETDQPLDDATKVSCTFIGKMQKPET
jgi:hypothetical protein